MRSFRCAKNIKSIIKLHPRVFQQANNSSYYCFDLLLQFYEVFHFHVVHGHPKEKVQWSHVRRPGTTCYRAINANPALRERIIQQTKKLSYSMYCCNYFSCRSIIFCNTFLKSCTEIFGTLY